MSRNTFSHGKRAYGDMSQMTRLNVDADGDYVMKPASVTTKEKHESIVPAEAPKPEFKLSPEQAFAMKNIHEGKNVLITGCAGTGKSHLLKLVTETDDPKVIKCAFTGLAAFNIGGCTIHSAFGLMISNNGGNVNREMLIKKSVNNQKVRQRCMMMTQLIIDEVSMVSDEMFGHIDEILQTIRQSDEPFGGVQLILFGDFLQLPPISKSKTEKPFCYKSPIWNEAKLMTIVLKTVFRQKNPTFIEVLNKLRIGVCDEQVDTTLASRVNADLKMPPGILPTKLYALKQEVGAENKMRLDEINSRLYEYYSLDDGIEPFLDFLKKNVNAVELLQLKVGAQVMLNRNLDTTQGLVNGARGVVVGFINPATGGTIKMKKSELEKSVVLAKPSSGDDSVDNNALDNNHNAEKLKKSVTDAQAEIRNACAGQSRRCKAITISEDAIKSITAADSSAMAAPTVAEGDENKDLEPVVQNGTFEIVPVVRFMDGKLRVIMPEVWESTQRHRVVASRTQIPLILAWATSVHKSQGQTLDCVEISMASMFELGMCYVAISRVKSLEGLRLLDYDKTKIAMVSEESLRFYGYPVPKTETFEERRDRINKKQTALLNRIGGGVKTTFNLQF